MVWFRAYRMLTVKALAELTELQEEYGWTNEKKYIFAAQEIMTFERNETLAFKKFCKNKATANGYGNLGDILIPFYFQVK